MSIKMMGQVWDLALTRKEKLILLALCDHADHEGKNAYPGVELLAYKTEYDERSVRGILRELEKKGTLIRRQRGRGGEGFAVYDIDLSGIPRRPPFVRKSGKPGPKPTGRNTRLNSVEKTVGNLESTGHSEQFNRVFQANQPGEIPGSDTPYLLPHEPSHEPSLSTVHDSAGAGPVENTEWATRYQDSLAVIEQRPLWTLASNDPGGLPVGVVGSLCGGIPPNEIELKYLVGFLVDSSFSGLAVYQLAEAIRGRVNGTKIHSVRYFFKEIERLQQFCHVQLAKPERHALLAGATPEQRWASELGVVRRIVEKWRKG